jgi:Hpt domain
MTRSGSLAKALSGITLSKLKVRLLPLRRECESPPFQYLFGSTNLWSSQKRDFHALSSLGHFLKGSSAAVGLIKLKASCEKIQNYGNKLDETGNHSISEDDALKKIAEVLVVAKKDFRDAEIWLKRFYGEDPSEDDVVVS